jgi:hypothetical protein
MLKMAKTDEALTDDPKPKDRLIWGRLRLAVEDEVIHRDWGCALYRLHRTGRINNDQREAGDKYGSLVRDYRKLWRDRMGDIEVYRGSGHTNDPGGHITPDRENKEPEKRSRATRDVETVMAHILADDLAPETEFEIKRAKKIGLHYREASEVAGVARGILEELLVDEVWPTGERAHREISYALTRLVHFFNTGTKRKHRK